MMFVEEWRLPSGRTCAHHPSIVVLVMMLESNGYGVRLCSYPTYSRYNCEWWWCYGVTVVILESTDYGVQP
jgi:hypothetical protein